MRKSQSPRYIRPESVLIGDVIRCTITKEDVTQSTVGKVARIVAPSTVWWFVSAKGLTIAAIEKINSKARVTLLERETDTFTPPLDWKEI